MEVYVSSTSAGDSVDTSTEVFMAHRELLFRIVYDLLGSVADTEDTLQETWLSWTGRQSRSDPADICNARAYLVKIAVNHALARRASIIRRRESYVGPWLPEPLITAEGDTDGADKALRAESVSMALLVVLETLSPLERAVFVLYDVFGYQYPEIAEILGRSPSAIRQLAHRARAHIQARHPRFRADPRVQRQVTEKFLVAALGGDLATLLEMMSPEVTMWTDGGGKVRAAIRPLRGADKVGRWVLGVIAGQPARFEARHVLVNGQPGLLLTSGGVLDNVVAADLDRDDRISAIRLIRNPDKLRHLATRDPAASSWPAAAASPQRCRRR
jgi:RNA polymerase sigma factor (sigma-70 family)